MQNEAEARQQIERPARARSPRRPSTRLEWRDRCRSARTPSARGRNAPPRNGGERIDEFVQRQDAAAADQPLRLHGEGDEGGKRRSARTGEGTGTRRARSAAARGSCPTACRLDPEEGRAAPGDERRNRVRIRPRSRAGIGRARARTLCPRMRKRQETGLGAAGAPAVGRDDIAPRAGTRLRKSSDIAPGPADRAGIRRCRPSAFANSAPNSRRTRNRRHR